MVVDFNVTRRALSIGAQDAVTGWYAKVWTESAAEIVIVPKAVQHILTGTGMYVRQDGLAVSLDPVEEGDEIKDAFGNYYEVKATKLHSLGDSAVYRESDLVLLPLHADRPATYGTGTTIQDARQRTKTYLDTYLDSLQLRKTITPRQPRTLRHGANLTIRLPKFS